MNAGKRKQLFNEINITPLTDIFLVLLIIMMVVAPMLQYPGLKLAVPSVGPSADTKEQPKTVQIHIDAHDRFSIDQKEVSSLMLGNAIRELKSTKPDGVVIDVDPNATHNAMTHAMDAAQTAGVEKVAVTESAPAGAAPAQ